MASQYDIVVLGASYAGLNVIHGLAKALDFLDGSMGRRVKITVLANSTHFWWSVGAPRAMLMPYPKSNDDSFIPVTTGLKQYGEDRVQFVHAQISGVDTAARTVAYREMNDAQDITEITSHIHFDTIVIALGSTGPSPLYALKGSHVPTLNAYLDVQSRVPSAQSILVVGGGSTGVETAGEVGTLYGKKTSAQSNDTKEITLLSGGDRLLPALRPAIGQRAQEMLQDMGVTVEHNLRVASQEKKADGKEHVTLSDGSTRTYDMVLTATGRTPATTCLPDSLLDEKKCVVVDEYMRTPSISSGYAVGDVASNTLGGVITIMTSGPATSNNILADLTQGKGKYKAKPWTPLTTKEMQLVPIGPAGGVGAVFGWWVPSLAVRMAKSRDFMFSKALKTVMGTA